MQWKHRIDFLNGDASWPLLEPLFKAVWPPDVIASCRGRFAFAHPGSGGAGSGRPGKRRQPCRYPAPRGHMEWAQDAGPAGIGGVFDPGGQSTPPATPSCCGSMPPSRTLKDEGATDFALLVLRTAHAPFYVGPRLEAVRTAKSIAISRRGGFASRPPAPYVYNSNARPAGWRGSTYAASLVTCGRPQWADGPDGFITCCP